MADPCVGEYTGLFSLCVTRLLGAIAHSMNALNGAGAELNKHIVWTLVLQHYPSKDKKSFNIMSIFQLLLNRALDEGLG